MTQNRPAPPGTQPDEDAELVENPGDPGPPTLEPPTLDDPRKNPKIPPQRDVPPEGA